MNAKTFFRLCLWPERPPDPGRSREELFDPEGNIFVASVDRKWVVIVIGRKDLPLAKGILAENGYQIVSEEESPSLPDLTERLPEGIFLLEGRMN